jgi:hypothetical protein
MWMGRDGDEGGVLPITGSALITPHAPPPPTFQQLPTPSMVVGSLRRHGRDLDGTTKLTEPRAWQM